MAWRSVALGLLLIAFVALTSMATPARGAATFVVNSTGDAGDATPGNGACATAGAVCTLRAAIEEANALAGADNINFSIGAGVQTISPATALPIITGAVDMNGTTQPGFAGTPIIELQGSAAPAGSNGLRITSGSTTIRGLVINRFVRSGLLTGGVSIEISGAGSNVIAGNYIGTNVAGTAGFVSAGGQGIEIASSGNQIGGTTVADRNIVVGPIAGGQYGNGIYVSSGSGNVVQGNYVGTGVTGTENLGNSLSGVQFNSGGNTLGGAAAGAGNLIVNNSYSAVRLNATGNLMQGNTVAAGGGSGMTWIQGGSGHRVSQNLMTAAPNLGIDLGTGPDLGRTPNDLGDGDGGANNFQNFPVITSASSTVTTTTIAGTLNSTASSTFTLEFFSTAVCSPAGSTTQAYLGSSVQLTDGTGNVAFNVTLPVPVSFGNSVVATAIASDGSTSEISDCQSVLMTPTVASQVHNAAHTDITNLTVATGTVVHDRAVVSGGGPVPTGTIDFTRYTTADCTGASSAENNVVLAGGIAESATHVTVDGTLSYKVHYDGNGSYATADGPCEPLLVATGGGFPPQGDDVFKSLGTFKILVAAPYQAMLQTCPIYNTTTAKIQSPVLYDPMTKVGRSSAFTQGSAGDSAGVPVGTAGTVIKDSDMPLRPAQFDGPASPRREVHTEIRTLNLQGFGAYVRAGTMAPARPISAGEVQSKDNAGTVALDFPAESFFNVFVEAKIPQCGAATTDILLYNLNTDPLLVENDNLTMFPPKVVYIHGNTNAVEVHFLSTNPGQWVAGDLFGWLILAGHGAGFDPNSPDDVNEFNGVINALPDMCAGTDGDCDGYVGPAATSHQGPRNTNPSVDNCPSAANADQLNTDGNFIDLTPPYALPASNDDKTLPNSDAAGDACDTDDDNDGRLDGDESLDANTDGDFLDAGDVLVYPVPGCAAATLPINRLLRDTDGDRVLDGAECALGFNPTLAASKPTAAQCAAFIIVTLSTDTDGDKLKDYIEFCYYNTDRNNSDTDGDKAIDGAKDGCEAASFNGDRIINVADQGMLASALSGAVAYHPNVDVNKDGVLNPADQGLVASFKSPAGQCPG